jgi:hypothetical protein
MLGLVPTLFGTDALFGAGRHLVDDVGEAEVRVDLLQQRRVGHAFGQDVSSVQKMCPSSCVNAAHAHDAVQAARGFVAVAIAELAVTQRQVPVALDALLEDQDVPRDSSSA